MTDFRRPLVLRLLGPSLGEVVDFAIERFGRTDRIIAWEMSPEVHAKVPDAEVATAFAERFGDALYSLDGRPLEAVAGALLAAAGRTVAVAESCTGGLLAGAMTRVPGCSAWFAGGVVAYSNALKQRLLGVPADLLSAHGAVSREVAEAMATGVRDVTDTDIGIAISGVAGPGGGTDAKPVGTVVLALAGPRGVRSWVHRFEGDREQVRVQAIGFALDLVRREAAGLALPPARGD